MQRVLSQSNKAWENTIGPQKWNLEVDAIASNEKGISLAEIKISKNKAELANACRQIVKRASFFSKIENLTHLFKSARNAELSEAVIVTLYDLGQQKVELGHELTALAESLGIGKDKVKIYDYSDIANEIRRWRSSNKERYYELFKTLNGLLERS